MAKVIKLPPFCQVERGNLVVFLSFVRDGFESKDIWISDDKISEELFQYVSDLFSVDSVTDITFRIRKFKVKDNVLESL